MRENRAVSTTIGYVLTLAIASILVAGLVSAGGSVVDSHRDATLREELSVVGQEVSGGIAMADRLVRSSDGGTQSVELTQQLPRSIVGKPYTIALKNPSDPYLVLASSGTDVSVRVYVETSTPVAESSVSGGPVRIVYDTSLSPAKLVIEHV